ncbi:AP-3 complex subunit sigma-1-like protein 1 [Sarcoptes scabiei]|uniref:AP complex subunit sigma n=1 Tax=Sarcoptes scabiei TaxID=52283 RepID=A0A132AB80_SARSC|nr:AP-3 complex subunit sigma-1-like protein 1 [Sarcoptes scabiei]
MIKAILVFNNNGKPRLTKFYEFFVGNNLIVSHSFLRKSSFVQNSLIGGSDFKLIYRHYATLYFVFCVDSSESELGILDLIQVRFEKKNTLILPHCKSFWQVFVETLDKCFENVCELDLIFHVDKVHNILNELVMGGMVLETNMTEIIARINEQNLLEKQEMGLSAAPARAVSAVKNMNISQQFRDIKLPDLSNIGSLKF